jgi:hypothetical protein
MMPPNTLTRIEAHKITRELLQREHRLGDEAIDHNIVNLLLDALGVPDYPRQSFGPPPIENKDQYTYWFGYEMRCTDDRYAKFFCANPNYTLEEELVGGQWMCSIQMFTEFKATGFNESRSTSRMQAENQMRSFVSKVAAIARELGISGALSPC